MRWLVMCVSMLGCSEYALEEDKSVADALQPALVAQPAAVDFGAAPLDGVSRARTVTLANEGRAGLSLLGLTMTGSGAFSVVGGAELPDALQPGDQHTLEVVWVPNTPADSATLWVESTDPQTPELGVPLTGTAEPGALSLSPDPLHLGELLVDLTTTGDFTLHNPSGQDITVDALALVGDASMRVVASPPLPTVLAPGDTAAVTVGWAPLETGTHLAELHVSHDAPGGIAKAQVRGEAKDDRCVVVVPDPLEFEPIYEYERKHEAVRIENVCASSVVVEDLSLVGDGEFSFFERPSLPAELAPGGMLLPRIEYAPESEGAHTATLVVTHNGIDNIVEAGILGTALEDTCLSDEAGFDKQPAAHLRVAGSDDPITITHTGIGGGFINEVWLESPERYALFTSHLDPVGTSVEVGPFEEGDLLVFSDYIHDTGYTWWTGAASMNVDNYVHASVWYLGACTWLVGFEDLYGGGDMDHDDVVFEVTGPLELAL